MNPQNIFVLVGIVAGALVLFWLVRKIVKFVLSVLIVILLAAAGVVYCVKAGYLSRETAERINPLANERIQKTVKDAGVWAGTQTKDAAKKALSAVVESAVAGIAPTNGPAR